jgi:serine/threonine protein kinase
MNPIAKDFLQKLLVRDPKLRLGSVNGITDVKKHPFFGGINWTNLMSEPVPWIP